MSKLVSEEAENEPSSKCSQLMDTALTLMEVYAQQYRRCMYCSSHDHCGRIIYELMTDTSKRLAGVFSDGERLHDIK